MKPLFFLHTAELPGRSCRCKICLEIDPFLFSAIIFKDVAVSTCLKTMQTPREGDWSPDLSFKKWSTLVLQTI